MRLRLYIYAFLLVMLCSCSETKYVAKGDYLLDNVEVKVEGKYDDISMDKMKSRVRQNGNSRWFSAIKIPLATYSLSGRDTTKWINRVLRSIGEPPVIYDSLRTAKSALDLKAELSNAGYLGASVDVETSKKNKKIDVTYIHRPGTPY